MIDPTDADIGRFVTYRDRSGSRVEEGPITSFTDKFVFVRFGHGSTSAGVLRKDLEWSISNE